MDLKPFFLSISYCDVEDRDMIKILWEECIPQGYYNFLKRPENFETLNSINVTFKDVKKMIKIICSYQILGARQLDFLHHIILSTNTFTHCCFQSLMLTLEWDKRTKLIFFCALRDGEKEKETCKLVKILLILL